MPKLESVAHTRMKKYLGKQPISVVPAGMTGERLDPTRGSTDRVGKHHVRTMNTANCEIKFENVLN
jgi:hypothetical protein